MTATAAVRKLEFNSLDEALAEVDRLALHGYEKRGNWDLSQICNHLADWMTYPVAGYPKQPFIIAWILGLLRITVGRKKMESFINTKSMPANSPTMPATVHQPTDPGPAIERLKAAKAALEAHTGEYHPSPLFGNVTRDETRKLQLVHCAHHLGFLEPRG